LWRQVADTHGGVKQLQQRALAGDAEMLAAALRRRSFDELSMLSVTAAVAAFWYNEARPSAEWRSAQRAAACAYGPSAELVVPSVAAGAEPRSACGRAAGCREDCGRARPFRRAG
jgi:soluble lytic murein transglycosylase-like protein